MMRSTCVEKSRLIILTIYKGEICCGLNTIFSEKSSKLTIFFCEMIWPITISAVKFVRSTEVLWTVRESEIGYSIIGAVCGLRLPVRALQA